MNQDKKDMNQEKTNMNQDKTDMNQEKINIKRDKINSRESGMDVVRAVACLFVVATHFYLNVGYYNEALAGKKMFIMTSFRWLFITCVPLFFMITGYFMLNKEINKKHYKGIIPLLASYVIISSGKMIFYNYLYGKIYTLKDMLVNLGNYQIAWYMGMYLCLFLLIPFLNRMWKALNRNEQNILISILVFLCTIYPIIKSVAPMYFVGVYPVMYYFIGTAIRERQYTFNRFALIGIALLISVMEAAISFRYTSTGLFDWNVISTADNTYGTLFMCITGVCIFLALYRIKVKSYAVKLILAAISKVSFEIYMFAGIYDAIIYSYLKRTVNGANEFFWWFFATVPASFILAAITSVIFKKIIDIIVNLFNKNK